MSLLTSGIKTRLVAFIVLCLIEHCRIGRKNVEGEKGKRTNNHAFFSNAAGGKETPIVIGHSANPRCFKGLRDNSWIILFFQY